MRDRLMGAATVQKFSIELDGRLRHGIIGPGMEPNTRPPEHVREQDVRIELR